VKILKRLLFGLFVLLSLLFVLRGWMYRKLVKYQVQDERRAYQAKDEVLIDLISSGIDSVKLQNAEDIIDHVLSQSSAQLHYSMANNDNDPNKLVYSKSAHCVGYAAFVTSSCNYLFAKYKLQNWNAQAYSAQVFFMDENIHRFFSNPFFKDHDCVLIHNKESGEIIAVDPTVHDYFWIMRVALRP
jgi:hypothetical protein